MSTTDSTARPGHPVWCDPDRCTVDAAGRGVHASLTNTRSVDAFELQSVIMLGTASPTVHCAELVLDADVLEAQDLRQLITALQEIEQELLVLDGAAHVAGCGPCQALTAMPEDEEQQSADGPGTVPADWAPVYDEGDAEPWYWNTPDVGPVASTWCADEGFRYQIDGAAGDVSHEEASDLAKALQETLVRNTATGLRTTGEETDR
ncbi:MAG: hypothetical protein ACOC84_00745 [Actinomycetota bacterium]